MKREGEKMILKRFCLFIILLLIVSMTLVGVSHVRANPLPIISLNPIEYEVQALGDTFTVDVNIADIPDLQGYEFKLWFDNTLLNATDVILGPINPPSTIYGPGKIVDSKYVWTPLQTVTDGFVWVAAAFPLGSPFTGGGGTLMTINFTAIATGDCALHLYEIVLGNPTGEAIDHGTLNGSVTVIPEFPAALVMPLLLIATLAVAFLGKMFWSRKRKGVLIKRERRITLLKRFSLALLFSLTFLILLSSLILVVVGEVLGTSSPKILSTYPYDGLTIGLSDFNEISACVQEVEGSLTSIRYYDSFVPHGIELLPVGSATNHSMWIPDVNNDGRVDDTDAYEVMLVLGSKPGNINWNPDSDVNGDEIINALDVIIVRIWYGTGTYATIHPNPSVGTVDFTFIAVDDAGNQTVITGTFTITGLPPPVGGHAVPIDISHFPDTKIGLAPGIGLASGLLAAMAITIILIRRRNKTLNGDTKDAQP